MKRLHAEESRELQVLDRYLSLHAGHVFEKAAPVRVRRLDSPPTSAPQHWRAAAIAFLVASSVLVFTLLGQAGIGSVAIPSLRGAPDQLEGMSRWRGSAALELTWGLVPEATHYSVQVWDFHGGMVASRVVEGPETMATVIVRSDAPRPLLWTVVAWGGTQRLAASELLTSMSAR